MATCEVDQCTLSRIIFVSSKSNEGRKKQSTYKVSKQVLSLGKILAVGVGDSLVNFPFHFAFLQAKPLLLNPKSGVQEVKLLLQVKVCMVLI